jgi:phage baseplate assembly protein W
LQLLLTVPGERVHRPNFGTRLRTSVFEQLDSIAMEEIVDDIKSALSQFEPRLIGSNVVVEPDDVNQLLKVTVVGSLSYDPTIQIKLETQLKAYGGFA